MQKLFKLLTIILLFLTVDLALAENLQIEAATIQGGVENFLEFMTLKGNHPIPLNASPAQSIAITHREQGILEANKDLAKKFATVVKAFQEAEDSKKEQAVQVAHKLINKDLGPKDIAGIEFIDGVPSAAMSSLAFVVDKKSSTAAAVVGMMSSYKLSPKPSDNFYFYSNMTDLQNATVTERVGNDQTWQGAGATPALNEGQTRLIKKCRKIIIVGWKCATDINHVNTMRIDGVAVPVLLLESFNLEKNKDSAFFNGDARTQNVSKGSTTLYLAVESGDKILFLGFGYSWNMSDNILKGIIQSEFRKDSLRLKSLIQSQIH